MPTSTKYTYSIQNDFPNAAVSLDRLEKEIRESSIITALDYVNKSGDDCDVWFKDALSSGDQSVLTDLVSAHSGDPLPETAPSVQLVNSEGLPLAGDEDRRLLIVPEPRAGTELIIVTHNFCDPTTWYSDSARADEVLSDSGDGLTFSGSHVNWIDMVHGRVFDSAALALEAPHEYAVVVVVDNVTASMREPYATSGGEYVVNYASGSITCVSGTWSGKVVRAAYSYAQSSRWKLSVDPGKRIDIEQAEAQFSSDVIMNDTIDFEVWVYNPYDFPNKFRYLLTSYPRLSNFIDEALGSYPVIPPIGGSARGTQNPIYGFPFRYGTVRKLSSVQGAELHVKLKDDKAFGGEHATATFYCTVRND